MNKVKKLPSSCSINYQNHNQSTNSIQVTLYPDENKSLTVDETEDSVNETLDNVIVDSRIPNNVQLVNRPNTKLHKNPSIICITPPESPDMSEKSNKEVEKFEPEK